MWSGENCKLSEKQEQLVSVTRRIFTQQRTDHGKVYSVHAPEVECIAKGKVHKHYEFGCKVPIVTTSRQSWIVGVDAVHDNPYDGTTLKPALTQVKRLTGVRPEEAFVDKGFRGQRYHPKGSGGVHHGTPQSHAAVEQVAQTPLGHRTGDWAYEA